MADLSLLNPAPKLLTTTQQQINMWNTMLLPLITSLFVLLSAAATPTEDGASFPTFMKRSTQCELALGHNIDRNDCHEAFGNLQTQPQFRADSVEGIAAGPRSEFSRTAIDRRFRLPQSFSVRTCTICVDLTGDVNALTLTRNNVLSGAKRLIDQCVYGQQLGGIDNRNGLFTMIVNEGNLSPDVRPAWEQCKRRMSSSLFDQRVQCLRSAWEEALARRRHGTSKR